MASSPAPLRPRRLRAFLLALPPAALAILAACALAHSEDEAQRHAQAEKPAGPTSLPPLPSVPPASASMAFSGWGIMPSTVSRSEKMPAMWLREPLGLGEAE